MSDASCLLLEGSYSTVWCANFRVFLGIAAELCAQRSWPSKFLIAPNPALNPYHPQPCTRSVPPHTDEGVSLDRRTHVQTDKFEETSPRPEAYTQTLRPSPGVAQAEGGLNCGAQEDVAGTAPPSVICPHSSEASTVHCQALGVVGFNGDRSLPAPSAPSTTPHPTPLT